MSVAKTTTKCPFCKEVIAVGATRCKHCHADLTGDKKKKAGAFADLNTFRTGFLTGVLFSVILAVLAYLQFFAGE
ncbi:MAG: hypothetical protein KKA42_12270 [candidate division Zixibacteria bacterium]|nr:hypothetical protein [candidate division Zixibacteria bacterium]